MKSKFKSSLFLGTALVMAFSATSAHAATRTKSATGTDLTDVTVGGTWDVVPTSADIASWTTGSLGSGLTVGTDVSWGGINISGALTNVGITGAGSITLGSSGITLTGNKTLTVANTIVLGSSQTWNIADATASSTADATFSGIISGAFNLTKSGAGTLVLSGANTYSGTTTVNGGILQLSGSGSLLSGTGITVNGGTSATVGSYPFNYTGIRSGMLVLNKTGDNLGSQTVTMNNGGLLYNSPAGGSDTGTVQNVTAASGHNEFMAAPAGGVTGDTLAITNLTVTSGATALFRSIYGTLGGSGDNGRITVGSLNGSALANTNGILGGWAYAVSGGSATGIGFATKAASTTDIIQATPDKATNISGATATNQALSTGGSAENWLVNGDGTSGNNTITSNLTINSLIEEQDVKINSGATLTLASGGLILRNNNFWMQSSSGTGYLTSGGNNLYLQADGGGGDQEIRVIIKDGASGAVALRKSGVGAVYLNQFNTYTGGTIINQGKLIAAGTTSFSVSTFGTGAVTINSGGTLQANGVHLFGWNAGTWNNFTINDGGTFAVGGNDNYIGNLTLADNAAITGTSYVGLATGTVSYSGSSSSKQATVASSLKLASPQGNVNATFTVNGTNTAGDLAVSGVIQGGGNLTKDGTGILVLSGSNTYTGATNVASGNLTVTGGNAIPNASAVTLSGTLTLGASETIGTLAGGGGVSLAANTLTLGTAASTSYSGVISGTGGLTKQGAGTQSLSAKSTYTGGTTVNNGVLDLTGGGGASGTIRGAVTVNTGGTLRLSTGDATGYNGGASSLNSISLIGGTLNVNTTSNQTLGSATLNMTGGSITGIAGSNLDLFNNGSAVNTLASATASTISLPTMNLRQDDTLFTIANGDAADDLLISSVIGNGSAGNHAMIKAGLGTMKLTGLNVFTGNVTVNAGTLDLSSGKLFSNAYNGTNIVTVNTGGTLKMGSFAYDAANGLGQLADYGARRVINGGTLEVTGATHSSGNDFNVGASGGIFRYNPTNTADTLTLDGNVNSNISTAGALTLQADGNITVAEIIEGTGSLTAAGTKTVKLDAANSYSGGTTVNAGADLRINGAQTGAGTVDVTATGKLSGSGSVIGGINVSGILAPGNSIESLGGGALSFTTGSTYAYELQTNLYGTTPGVAGDLTYSSGTLSIANGTILTLSDLATSTALLSDSKLTLISSVGAWNGGLFTYLGTPLADDSTFTLGANQWLFNYNDTVEGLNYASDSTGSFVTMTVVPEPNAAMLVGGLGMLALLRRRRA